MSGYTLPDYEAAAAAAEAAYTTERADVKGARAAVQAAHAAFKAAREARREFIAWYKGMSKLEREKWASNFGPGRYEQELARMTASIEEKKATLLAATATRDTEVDQFGAAKSAWGTAQEEVTSWLELQTSLHNANPWMPAELLAMYAAMWSEYGDADEATNALYQTPEFSGYFPGLVREDGTLRMAPIEYVAARATFDWTLANTYGINPGLLGENFVHLIEGDVSMDEWKSRMSAVWERVTQADPSYAASFANFFGTPGETGLTAMLVLAMDPGLNDAMLNRQISMAEIAGSGAISGYMIDESLAGRLYEAGMNEATAQSTFQGANESLPVLGQAGGRQFEGGWSLDQYLEAQVFGSAGERSRIRRTLAGEASAFTEADAFQKSDVGALVGLRRR